MPTDVEWDLSPTDFPRLGLVRYLPFAFYGAYLGPPLIGGLLDLPALFSNPGLLALVALLVLVGGPMSLLYLLPMIRDPDQRPDADQMGWLATLDPPVVGLAALLGVLAGLVVTATIGSSALYLLFVAGVVISLPVLGLFDTEGDIDAEAGTLTVQERTIDVDTLAGIRTYHFGTIAVCRLSYVAGAGGVGRPYVFAVPNAVADEVLSVLEAGVATDADVEPRATDHTARVVLVGVALLFLGVAAGSLLVLADAGVFVAVITGGLGLLFLAGAFVVA